MKRISILCTASQRDYTKCENGKAIYALEYVSEALRSSFVV